MYATGTSNSATGYGSGLSAGYGGARGLGAMRAGISPEQMGLQPVNLRDYVPDNKASNMYDPGACRRELAGREVYRQARQNQPPIKLPIGLYPSDFSVTGFDMKNTKSFKSEFKPSYN